MMQNWHYVSKYIEVYIDDTFISQHPFFCPSTFADFFASDLSSPHARCCCEWNAPRQRSMEGNLPTSEIHGSSRHVDLERCRFRVDFGADSGKWKGALTKNLWKFVWRLDLKTLYATFWMPNRFLMIQHKDILFEHDLQHSWDAWEVLWAIWFLNLAFREGGMSLHPRRKKNSTRGEPFRSIALKVSSCGFRLFCFLNLCWILESCISCRRREASKAMYSSSNNLAFWIVSCISAIFSCVFFIVQLAEALNCSKAPGSKMVTKLHSSAATLNVGA